MRNLELLGHKSFKVDGARIETPAFIANDPETSTTYIAYENEGSVFVAANNLSMASTADFGVIGRIKASPIVSFTYLSELEVACLCTYDGDIWQFSKERFENSEEAVMISVIHSLHRFCRVLNFFVVL